MPWHDVIVVGSGPAGVSAAWGLRPLNVLMLDVGFRSSDARLPAEALDSTRRRADVSDVLIGDQFDALHNLERSYLSPKLKSPLMRFITRAPRGIHDTPSPDFSAALSYAQGGLANAWGAGVFRYDDHDLAGWPITAAELAPHYDALTAHIGVSGEADDLTPYFGRADDLQPALPLSTLATRFLLRYARRRRQFNAAGVHVGRLRSAILTQPHNGRPAHAIHNQEFFQPDLRSIYHPGFTLEALRADGALTYRDQMHVTRYREIDGGVAVIAGHVETGIEEEFHARHLVLGAGALNSARIVLASNSDHRSRLPLLDNPLSYLPIIDVGRIGAALDVTAFAGGELCVLHEGRVGEDRVQGTFYGLAAPLRGDLFAELPLSLRGNVMALRYVIPALGMIQLFYPDRPAASNFLRLTDRGSLDIQYSRRSSGTLERLLIGQLRRSGYLAMPNLVQYPLPGSSMHYAGTLPMSANPRGRYETDRFGRLPGSGRVRVVDGAVFPHLPSKNHTFTIMANAVRIAHHLKEHVA